MVKAKKLKEFTIRRRPIVMSFLKKSRMYPKLYGEIGDKAWMERLIIFLVEPKPCRATPRDITAWLKLPEVVEEMAKMDENPPASPDISANYEKPPTGSSWPWPSFPAALGLVSLPGRKTEEEAESTPKEADVGGSSGRKNVARVTVKGPEGAGPIGQSNCIIM